MKIAIVSEHASPLALLGGTDSGGQNVYVANVARQLARHGHKVDVFTRRESAEQPARAALCPGVRVINVTAGPPAVMPKEALLPYMGEFAANLIDYYRTEKRAGEGYSVTHANFFMSGLAGLEAKRALGVPLVVTFHALGKVRRLHQGADDGFPLERIQIEETLVAECDGIVAECPQDKDDLLHLYDGDVRKLAVVPCGFDGREFFPVPRLAARAQLGLPREGFAILQLGRMVPRKGVDNVIRAVAELRDAYDDAATLYVVGGNSDAPDDAATPEIGRLRKIAHELNVADCVHFLGRRDRDVLRLFYSACDVFVTTPWYEPFGITPLEAMACARPVIGSDVGGIRSTVVHNKTGVLVPPRDPGALALHLHELIGNDKRRQVLGDAGFARAQRFYTWAGVVRGLETVYLGAVHTAAATAQAAAARVTVQRQSVRPRPVAPVMRPPQKNAPGRAIQRTSHER